MSVKAKILNQLKETNTLADFYTDVYNCSSFGFVLDYNDEFVIIERFNDESNYDGLTIFFLENISRIRWEGNEIHSIAKVIDVSKRLNGIPNIDLNSIHSILESIQKHFDFLTIHTENLDTEVCFIGEISDLDSETIVIHEYGTMISLDRKYVLLNIHDITRIDLKGSYELKLKKILNV